jgi:hypothetical protein
MRQSFMDNFVAHAPRNGSRRELVNEHDRGALVDLFFTPSSVVRWGI